MRERERERVRKRVESRWNLIYHWKIDNMPLAGWNSSGIPSKGFLFIVITQTSNWRNIKHTSVVQRYSCKKVVKIIRVVRLWKGNENLIKEK